MTVTRLLIVVGLWLAVPAWAQPSISGVSGTLTDGSSITVSGTGFGSHADYGGAQAFLNRAWCSFDGGSFTCGNWDLDGVNNSAWTLETTGDNRTNSSHFARKRYDAGIAEGIRRLGEYTPDGGSTMSSSTGVFFASAWFWPETSADGKFFRIYGDAGDIFLNAAGDSGVGCAGSRGLSGLSNVGGTPAPSTIWGTTEEFAADWQRIDIYLRDTSSDDYMSVTVSGTRIMQRGSQLASNAPACGGSGSNEQQQWVYSPWGGDGHTWSFGHMIDAAAWRFDDVFANYTQARVEVCSASTWAACTGPEIQLPTAWSATSLTVTLNEGALADLSAAYLYVVDADGNVNSNGFALSQGEASPTTPIRLRIRGADLGWFTLGLLPLLWRRLRIRGEDQREPVQWAAQQGTGAEAVGS